MKTISEVRKELKGRGLKMPDKRLIKLINKKLKELPWKWFHAYIHRNKFVKAQYRQEQEEHRTNSNQLLIVEREMDDGEQVVEIDPNKLV